MGYTHYWEFKAAPKDLENGAEKWNKAVETIKSGLKAVKEMGIEICNGVGKDKPIINGKEIIFNGTEKGGLDHETFYIPFNAGGWNFCKTARKPYDLLVCIALLAFKEAFGEDFSYSSDGVTRESIKDKENLEYWKSIGWEPKIEEEWQTAYDLYGRLTA